MDTPVGSKFKLYTPTRVSDGATEVLLEAISADLRWENKSFEEIRLEDMTNQPASKGFSFKESEKKEASPFTTNGTSKEETPPMPLNRFSFTPEKKILNPFELNGTKEDTTAREEEGTTAAPPNASTSADNGSQPTSPFFGFGNNKTASSPANDTPNFTFKVSPDITTATSALSPPRKLESRKRSERREKTMERNEQKNKSAGTTPFKLTSPPPKNQNPRPDATEFENLTKEHIRPLIELNDQINALTSDENTINATRIVVAGDQSHGKTSLLEALSGVDLPRGEGIQTRVPLVLQLRAAAATTTTVLKNNDDREYATIKLESSNDSPEEISLDQIADKVREYTTRAAGEAKDIKDEPIELKIYRTDQDDLTLVDLPGWTRVAIQGQAGGDGEALEAMIRKMYTKYMKPTESILLNVVSAMVDFSTSASLQLSRKLDKKKGNRRTLLCVTKIDEYQDENLNEKIAQDILNMELSSDRVFAVRNRSKTENDRDVSLADVRVLEKEVLDKLAAHDETPPDYGLGVDALSKELVKVQYEQIIETLPKARQSILKQIDLLEKRMEKLGHTVESGAECRTTVMQCVEASINEFQNEVVGRATFLSSTEQEGCDGESFELCLTIDDIKALRKQKGSKIWTQTQRIHFGGNQFELNVSGPTECGEGRGSIKAYISATPNRSIVRSMVLDCTISATTGNKFYSHHVEDDFVNKLNLIGWSEIIPGHDAAKIDSPVTFQASIFAEKIILEKQDLSSKKPFLLCAHLNGLQDEFTSDVDHLYTNQFFFSSAFRKKLAKEISASRGGAGLPGTIAPHVPINILKMLRQQLPTLVGKYRDTVWNACIDKMKIIIDSHFDLELYPRLNKFAKAKATSLFQEHKDKLADHHDLILEWEETVCSSNHYFMDTVQAVRKSIAEDEENRPPYLKHFSDKEIKEMSNEEQRLVDMQIELFAYWKLVKKRLVDYIIMSTHSELVNNPINDLLKSHLLEATLSHKDDDLIKLLLADPATVRERAKVSARLDKLYKARSSIDSYDEVMQL